MKPFCKRKRSGTINHLFYGSSFLFLLLFISCGTENGTFSKPTCKETVVTPRGEFSGKEDGPKTCAYTGIRFGKPPKGEKRFRPSEMVPPHEGIYKAEGWGNVCPQMIYFREGGFFLPPAGDEDCLFLHIWTPKEKGKRPYPVMVFIHGGAFTVGAGSWSSYRGTKLAEKGVVVVTIHYRLGPFGFLTLPELKGEDPEGSVGNYGISDQIVALQWVHENISAFGGDPNNVTIFGESAGAMSVCTLLAIPSAHPYFHKAIMESGGCSAVGIPPTSYTSSLSFVERTGCGGRGDPLRCLRSLSPKELLLKGKPDIIRDGFQPQVDSVLLQEIPLKALEKGIAKEIPLLAGANDDELMLGLIVNPPALSYKWKGWSAYEKRLKEIFPPEEASALLTLYPKEKYPDPVSAWEDILGDYVLRCPTYFALDRQKRHQNLVFHYHFNWDKVFKRSDTLQSFHALELAFVFGPYDVWSVLFGDTLPTAIEASEIIQNYWVEFAKKGDPNREDLPPWVPFTEGKTILLGEKVELIDDPLKERCSYWDGKIPTGLENLTKGIWSL